MTTTLTKTCELCGLPAHHPLPALSGQSSPIFCCSGCRQVYQILLESGQLSTGADPKQTSLYQQCLAMGLIAQPAEAPSTSQEQPRTHEHSPAYDVTREAAFQIGGMWCSACAWLIENALLQVNGVSSCRALFVSDIVRITYRPSRTTPEELAEAIRKLGYTTSPYTGGVAATEAGEARRQNLRRAAIAALFSVNAMMFQMMLYYGYWLDLNRAGETVAAVGAGLMALPTLWAGWPIARKAWSAARQGTATMETLVTLGAGTAYAFSGWALLRGDFHHIYFDTAGMLVALILIGKFVESGAKGQATGAITLLYALLPKKATLLMPDGQEALVAVEKLGPGDRVLVRPGERIPADGRVYASSGTVDESLLSGESRPVMKSAGDPVTGGTIAADASLTIQVLKTGRDTTVAQMISLVEDALAGKSQTERWADSVARHFVPVILALAAMTGAGMALTHHTPDSLMARVVSVLVIACPCALALATPLAITTAVGMAATSGLLIANTEVLETLPKVKHLLLDKTGTLTEGCFRVHSFVSKEEGDLQSDLAALAALETASEHPLARAVRAYAAENALAAAGRHLVSDFQRSEGGVAGHVGDQSWWIGNRFLAAAQNAVIPDDFEQMASTQEALGLTVLFFGLARSSALSKGTLRGIVSLGDAPRPDAAAMVRRLGELGLTVEVVSGDSERTTQTVARSVGIAQATAQMSAAKKADRVKSWQASGSVVAMAGDGINDTPALAQADVGIAFGSGTEIARRAADITLIGDEIGRLADLFTLARKTARVIRQNLIWACLYNAICLPLAMLGYVTPLVAAAAMLVSSLSVILNSRRLHGQLKRGSG